MVLARYHFLHKPSATLVRVILDALLECLVGDFHRSLLRVVRFEEREPVIQTSAPFLFCCVAVVRGDISGAGLLALILPLIPALLIVGHAVALVVLMCCGCVWIPNASTISSSDLCSF